MWVKSLAGIRLEISTVCFRICSAEAFCSCLKHGKEFRVSV